MFTTQEYLGKQSLFSSKFNVSLTKHDWLPETYIIMDRVAGTMFEANQKEVSEYYDELIDIDRIERQDTLARIPKIKPTRSPANMYKAHKTISAYTRDNLI